MGILTTLPEWIWLTATAVSVATFFGSLIVLRILVIRMPHDYFARARPAPSSWANHHPVVRMTVLVVKNFLGLVLLVLGIIMLFTPGQGVLSILMGLSLVNLPGKRSVERRIVAKPVVLRALNRIRARSGHPPLVVQSDSE